MPENTTIQPTPVVESQTPVSHISAGEVAAPYEMLGRSLDRLGEGLEKLAVPFAERAGTDSVTTDDQGNVTVARLPIFGAAGVAYSRALKVSVLAQADGAVTRKDIELSKQYPNDPEAYLAAANQFKDTFVKHVTDQAGPEVGEAIGRHIDDSTTRNYRRLANEQQVTIKRNFDKDTAWAIDSNKENLVSLIRNGGADTPEAAKYIRNIHAALAERANNPILMAPESEADKVLTDLHQNMDAAAFEHRVNGVLANPSTPYQSDIEASANKYGVDSNTLARLLYQESSFRENAVSPAGARGIAQFMPETAARYGVDVRNPQSSIEGAAHYMSDLSRQFGGNTGLALAGYNWGEKNVAQWMAAGANPAAMPQETRNYVRAITGQPVEAWIAGQRPSPFASQPQGSGGVQKALDMAEAERRSNPDPVQGQINYERGLAAIKDYHDGVVRRTNLASLGQKQTDENFENQIIQDQASAKPMITENDIKTAAGVSPESKMRMLSWIKREDMPEPLARVSQGNAMDLFRRINLPDGDPGKISNVSQIRDTFVNGGLTRADEEWLEKRFTEGRSPQGERLTQLRSEFSKAVEPTIDHSNPLMGSMDPEGKLQAYRFQRFVDQKVDEYRQAGKSPFDLFDPSKPDYLGKPEVLQPYQPTLQQSIQATTSRLMRGVAPPGPGGSTIPPMIAPTTAAPAIPQRRPGETPAEYLTRTGQQ
jgi:Transglycosylase SLT domain